MVQTSVISGNSFCISVNGTILAGQNQLPAFMQKFIALLICFSCSIIFFSCQKEIELSDPSQGTGGSGSGSTAASYYPLTKDSWWKFKDSLTGVISDGKVLNRTKNINGIVYTAIVPVSAPAPDTAWFAAPRPNYYITQKGASPSGSMYDVVFHYLNDTASVGYSWQYTAGHGNGFTAYVKTTIMQKGISMTVAGKNYTNVIHTKLDLSYNVLGTVMDFGSYNYFIARGIGIIKIRSEFSVMGMPMLQTAADLLDYSIK
jgi:hypothetical protein